MPHAMIHATCNDTCHMQSYMPHAMIHATYNDTCHIQSYMPHAMIHATCNDTCHMQSYMPQSITNAPYSHKCLIQSHMPHTVTYAVIHSTYSHTSCYHNHLFTRLETTTNRHDLSEYRDVYLPVTITSCCCYVESGRHFQNAVLNC